MFNPEDSPVHTSGFVHVIDYGQYQTPHWGYPAPQAPISAPHLCPDCDRCPGCGRRRVDIPPAPTITWC